MSRAASRRAPEGGRCGRVFRGGPPVVEVHGRGVRVPRVHHRADTRREERDVARLHRLLWWAGGASNSGNEHRTRRTEKQRRAARAAGAAAGRLLRARGRGRHLAGVAGGRAVRLGGHLAVDDGDVDAGLLPHLRGGDDRASVLASHSAGWGMRGRRVGTGVGSSGRTLPLLSTRVMPPPPPGRVQVSSRNLVPGSGARRGGRGVRWLGRGAGHLPPGRHR